jgi:hypothetical protein
MLDWLTWPAGQLLRTGGVVAGWFSSKDATSFTVIQMMVATLVLAAFAAAREGAGGIATPDRCKTAAWSVPGAAARESAVAPESGAGPPAAATPRPRVFSGIQYFMRRITSRSL